MTAAPKLIRSLPNLYANGYRLCNNQSARKHRKQGHHVKYVGELRCYAWRHKDQPK